jgi:hypothetical protein
VASGTGCTISGQLLKSEVATTCVVIATKAASTGFNAITSAAMSFRFANANQATLSISNTVLVKIPGSTFIVTTTGGSGAGAVSLSVSGIGCSMSGSSLTASAVATCVVTATKDASSGFNAITSAAMSFSFANANQASLTISNKVLATSPGSRFSVTTTGGSGTGEVSYSVSGTGCSMSGSSLTASAVATCVVTATKDASSGFNAITSAAKIFSFANANQASLNITYTVLRSIPGSAINLTTSGGSGTGEVSYLVSGTGCSISGSTLTAAVVTSCVVTASKAASTGYNSATSPTISFVFALPDPPPPASIPLYWVVYPDSLFCPNKSFRAEFGFGTSNGSLVVGLTIEFDFSGKKFYAITNEEGKAVYSYFVTNETELLVRAMYGGGSAVKAVQSTLRTFRRNSGC